MDLITALQITPPSKAASSVKPPCDEITERVPGDASLNRALALIFEFLLDQSTMTGRLTTMDVALDAWGRNHDLFFDRITNGEPVRQSMRGWNELLAVLHRWRDQIVDEIHKPVPRSPVAPFVVPNLFAVFEPDIGVA